jgi:hypothetical protein
MAPSPKVFFVSDANESSIIDGTAIAIHSSLLADYLYLRQTAVEIRGAVCIHQTRLRVNLLTGGLRGGAHSERRCP